MRNLAGSTRVAKTTAAHHRPRIALTTVETIGSCKLDSQGPRPHFGRGEVARAPLRSSLHRSGMSRHTPKSSHYTDEFTGGGSCAEESGCSSRPLPRSWLDWCSHCLRSPLRGIDRRRCRPPSSKPRWGARPSKSLPDFTFPTLSDRLCLASHKPMARLGRECLFLSRRILAKARPIVGLVGDSGDFSPQS